MAAFENELSWMMLDRLREEAIEFRSPSAIAQVRLDREIKI